MGTTAVPKFNHGWDLLDGPDGGDCTLTHVAKLMRHRFPDAEEFIPEDATTPWQGVLFLRIDPSVISLVDYRTCFGHTELYEVGLLAASDESSS